MVLGHNTCEVPWGQYSLQFDGTHAVSPAKVISLWTRTYNPGEYTGAGRARGKSTSGSVRVIEGTGNTQLLLLVSCSHMFYVTDTAVFGLTQTVHPEGWHSTRPECCFRAGTLAMSSVGPHSPLWVQLLLNIWHVMPSMYSTEGAHSYTSFTEEWVHCLHGQSRGIPFLKITHFISKLAKALQTEKTIYHNWNSCSCQD